MKRRVFQASILGSALVLAGLQAAQAQQVIKLTAAAGHPPVFLWVKTLDETFIPEVDKKLAVTGKYKIDWTRAYGGTLMKVGSESKGVADGIADVGVVSTLFEAPKFPLQNVSYFAPFGTDRVDVVSKTIAQLQKNVPAMAEAWTKNGLVYLGGMALDSYHIWSKFPITRFEDLNGKKISAPGPAANWIRGTGAVAVAGSLNTYYEDMKSGVSDGVVVFTTGAAAAKLQEVAPYITKVNFGSMYAGGIAFNKNRFDRLPPEVRTAIMEAGTTYTEAFAKAQSALVDLRMQQMVAAGAKVGELSDAERKRWADALSPVAKSWGAQAQSKGLPASDVINGYMAALQEAGVKVPRDWSK
jgi:TRAP-type transport system periplasmic protein